jgi:hypothetical protein
VLVLVLVLEASAATVYDYEHDHDFSHIRGGDQPEVSVFVGFLMSGSPPLLL